jgi:hypothetical protein
MGRAGPCSLGWIGLTGREWAPTITAPGILGEGCEQEIVYC